MHPFDFKSALLAKHAQHVVLVHFPIALFLTGVAFDLSAQWRKRQALADAAYYNFLVAAVTTLPVLASGLLAWQWQLEGTPLQGTLLLHALFGLTSAGGILVLWWLRFRQRHQSDHAPGSLYLALTLIVLLLVAVTGHLGGFVSGVNTAGN